jgi:hypothetical protein
MRYIIRTNENNRPYTVKRFANRESAILGLVELYESVKYTDCPEHIYEQIEADEEIYIRFEDPNLNALYWIEPEYNDED